MILLLIIVIKRRRREGDKTQVRQVMTIQLLIPCWPSAQLGPDPPSASSFQVISPVHILGMTFYKVKLPFGQFRAPVPTLLPPSCLCISSLADHGTLKSPWLRINTPEQQPDHQCVSNIKYQQYKFSYWVQNRPEAADKKKNASSSQHPT